MPVHYFRRACQLLALSAAVLMGSTAAVANAQGPSLVSPNVPPTGFCQVCTKYQTYPGHEDESCHSACTVVCSTKLNPIACNAACYGICWVPGYQICTQYAYEPCPL